MDEQYFVIKRSNSSVVDCQNSRYDLANAAIHQIIISRRVRIENIPWTDKTPG